MAWSRMPGASRMASSARRPNSCRLTGRCCSHRLTGTRWSWSLTLRNSPICTRAVGTALHCPALSACAAARGSDAAGAWPPAAKMLCTALYGWRGDGGAVVPTTFSTPCWIAASGVDTVSKWMASLAKPKLPLPVADLICALSRAITTVEATAGTPEARGPMSSTSWMMAPSKLLFLSARPSPSVYPANGEPNSFGRVQEVGSPSAPSTDALDKLPQPAP